ncbi:MAG: phosphoribosylformylglycinamidine synthase subunit PurQ, partial [Chromatiales bacterium]|nr:phosphoribosylformylglycinamidine synthase subunit PurQ [Chromatiales bacterium]
MAAPFIANGARPRVAILRDGIVSGHVAIAAAQFDVQVGRWTCTRAMSWKIGSMSQGCFSGLACGGFSYGDVLGAGGGWVMVILFNARALDEFAGFRPRGQGAGSCIDYRLTLATVT